MFYYRHPAGRTTTSLLVQTVWYKHGVKKKKVCLCCLRHSEARDGLRVRPWGRWWMKEALDHHLPSQTDDPPKQIHPSVRGSIKSQQLQWTSTAEDVELKLINVQTLDVCPTAVCAGLILHLKEAIAWEVEFYLCCRPAAGYITSCLHVT